MRLIIFDMDGTLVDTVGLIVETVGDAFASVGEIAPEERAIRSISGITIHEAVSILAPRSTASRRDELVESYRRQYRSRAGRDREPLFKGAIEAIDRLRAQPGTILAIATGKGLHGATALLDAHGIRGHFHSIQTPDNNRGKPDPQMVETAMTRAGASRAETVMVGDTVHDMRMARAAGVAAIGVAWGYHDRGALRDAGAHEIIEAFDDLDHAVDRLIG